MPLDVIHRLAMTLTLTTAMCMCLLLHRIPIAVQFLNGGRPITAHNLPRSTVSPQRLFLVARVVAVVDDDDDSSDLPPECLLVRAKLSSKEMIQ
eukprot:scaffold427_cov103-Alexandrium_tamarense.AAC.10